MFTQNNDNIYLETHNKYSPAISPPNRQAQNTFPTNERSNPPKVFV